jgi:hypothetical protein
LELWSGGGVVSGVVVTVVVLLTRVVAMAEPGRRRENTGGVETLEQTLEQTLLSLEAADLYLRGELP